MKSFSKINEKVFKNVKILFTLKKCLYPLGYRKNFCYLFFSSFFIWNKSRYIVFRGHVEDDFSIQFQEDNGCADSFCKLFYDVWIKILALNRYLIISNQGFGLKWNLSMFSCPNNSFYINIMKHLGKSVLVISRRYQAGQSK